jgi:hypothetical protein
MNAWSPGLRFGPARPQRSYFATARMSVFGFVLALAGVLQMPVSPAHAQGGGFTLPAPPTARGYCLRDRMTRETICGYASVAQCRTAAKNRQADCLLASHIDGGKDLLMGR